MNNTALPAVLLVVGEAPKPENRVFYPLNPDLQPAAAIPGTTRPPTHPSAPRRPAKSLISDD